MLSSRPVAIFSLPRSAGSSGDVYTGTKSYLPIELRMKEVDISLDLVFHSIEELLGSSAIKSLRVPLGTNPKSKTSTPKQKPSQ
ncbi:hypothetical protein BCON_0150g00010 [Botryotinia convoluta]|uniref:Uncharacterized protein n=1 Tax=Botryotinia convoluta TaxID=54673 RepID=A0A4Z1HS69_9HELO|nr:hypothetical protein BCON_0150g00010 [Botryotinia convoluta]